MIQFIEGFATSSGAVLVYLFAPTGEYLGPSTVHVSEGCGLPAGATLEEPPKPEPGFSVQWVDGAWAIAQDHRGTVYQIADGEPVEHLELGPLPDNVTIEPRPTPDHLWKEGGWTFDEQLQADNRQAYREALLARIDQAADLARRSVIGDPGQALEYDRVAAEAQAFKEAGYPAKAIPKFVAAGITSGQSAQQVADSILAAHDRYSDQLVQIRAARLVSKARVRDLLQNDQVEEALQVVNTAEVTLMEIGE